SCGSVPSLRWCSWRFPRWPGVACNARRELENGFASADLEAVRVDLLHAADVLGDTHGELPFGGAVHQSAERHDAIERRHRNVEAVHATREHQRGPHFGGDPRVRHGLFGFLVLRLELVRAI